MSLAISVIGGLLFVVVMVLMGIERHLERIADELERKGRP